MTWRSACRGRLAVAWLVVAGTWSPAHAQDAPRPSPPVAETVPAPATPAAPPPVWVAGVVVTADQRSAVLVLLDDNRREIGLLTLREGESFSGYRLAAVEPSRVLIEQNGTIHSVAVGRPRAEPDAGRRVIFVPGPDRPTPDLEATGRPTNRRPPAATDGGPPPDPEAVQGFLERLFNDPTLRDRIEQRRPLMRQRLERARQDGQAAPEASGATPKPPQRTGP